MTQHPGTRKTAELLGYNLGTYHDWDGDDLSQQFYDWRPEKATDLKITVPNHRGNELMLTIQMESGEVTIQDYEDPEYIDNGKGWVTLLTTTWRELVGHKSEKPLDDIISPGD